MKTIVLPHDHTHEGTRYPAGSEIELPDDKYEWFLKATEAMRSAPKHGSVEWARERFEPARKHQEMVAKRPGRARR